MAQKMAVKEFAFRLRNLRLRLPFRFGAFTLEEVPLLHLALQVEAPRGRRAEGFAADNLVPRWFDKAPEKTPRDNILDLVSSARLAAQIYSQAARSPRPFWDIWRDAYGECLRRGERDGLNNLVSSFGSSLLERALADAAGRLESLDLGAMLRQNTLGLRPGEIHPELQGADLAAWAAREPPSALWVRHTVGLLDPLSAGDLRPDGGPQDGLPVTLEENAARYGLRFFKLKIGGNPEEDLERLRRVAHVLDRRVPEPYRVTLDGNEQYRSLDDFAFFFRRLRSAPGLERLCRSLSFIEQPLDRRVALDPAATAGLPEISRACPVIIDESDDSLEAFARAIDLGYRGVSAKNCKGIIKSFLNRTLAEKRNRTLPEGQGLFLSAEDLTNVPVVPLQQDLATARALGIAHLERNGHHYVAGLAHCSERERQAATALHRGLYRGDGKEAWLRIVEGRIRVDSLTAPGYGGAFDPDLASMTPLETWAGEDRSPTAPSRPGQRE